MLQRLATSRWATPLVLSHAPFGCTSMVVAVTAGYLAIGLLAFAGWRLTGNDAWVEDFFRLPGALLLVWLAAIEVLFSLRVSYEFSPGQPLHRAWRLIAFSAGFDLAGAILIQVLGVRSALNPLAHTAWWPAPAASAIRQSGLVMGGSCRFTMLAAGLFWVVRVYRQSGFLARLAAVDWMVLALFGSYIVRETGDVVAAIHGGARPGLGMVLGWPVDPLLLLLLGQAMLLNRSVKHTGDGWIGRCWRAFALGIFLVSLGDVAIWAANSGFLPWPWSALQWYVWIPAAGAFALAPAYQLEAIYHARGTWDPAVSDE